MKAEVYLKINYSKLYFTLNSLGFLIYSLIHTLHIQDILLCSFGNNSISSRGIFTVLHQQFELLTWQLLSFLQKGQDLSVNFIFPHYLKVYSK